MNDIMWLAGGIFVIQNLLQLQAWVGRSLISSVKKKKGEAWSMVGVFTCNWAKSWIVLKKRVLIVFSCSGIFHYSTFYSYSFVITFPYTWKITAHKSPGHTFWNRDSISLYRLLLLYLNYLFLRIEYEDLKMDYIFFPLQLRSSHSLLLFLYHQVQINPFQY